MERILGAIKRRFTREPTRDKSLVGITFVDVLFALVIARVLEPFARASDLSPASISHLMLAGVLTVSSWIGYHNSWNRPRYLIRFFNLPFWQFLVDVLLVVVYWMNATYAEGIPTDVGITTATPPRANSALPEAIFVVITFALYATWDWIGKAIRNAKGYKRRRRDLDVPSRRVVTIVCLLISIGIAVWVWYLRPSTTKSIVAMDIGLFLLIIGFRVAKEAVTDPDIYQRRFTHEENDDDDHEDDVGD